MHCVPFLIIDPYFEQFSVCKWGLYSKLIWCSSDRISHVFDSLWEIHCETSLLPWQRKRIRWTLHNIRRRYARNIYIFLVTEKMEEERGGEEEIYFTIFPQLSYDPMNCFVEWMQHSRASQHWKMIPVLTDNEFIIHYCILVGQHSWRFKYAILRILFDVLAWSWLAGQDTIDIG